MSLTGALANAVGGLTVNARSVGVVSSNIANALTEGYGRRELAVSSSANGSYGGVQIDGVRRHSDPVLLAQRRLSDAEAGNAQDLQKFFSDMERLFGSPMDTDSFTSRVTSLEASLVTASTDPSSEQRLKSVAYAAENLSNKFNSIAEGVQNARVAAESVISSFVEKLNQGISTVKDLNARISTALHTGHDTSSLMDQRQKSIDEISEIIPIRLLPRDRETVALVTTGGAILLDGTAHEFGFTRSHEILPHMTLGNNLLSALTLDGKPVDTGESGRVVGGKLAAQFKIRDEATVVIQEKIDALAFDLATAFGSGGVDETIPSTSAGLFTDRGARVDASSEIGLSQRLSLNRLVRPESDEIWRLRDGLGAAHPGPSGNASLINAIHDRLVDATFPTSSNIQNAQRTFFDRVSEVSDFVAVNRVRADETTSLTQAQRVTLKELEYSQGVDTDAELERLLRIEQNYAANAQVISVVDDMMQKILNI